MVFMLEEYPHVRSSSTEVLDHPWVSVNMHQIYFVRDDFVIVQFFSTCVLGDLV